MGMRLSRLREGTDPAVVSDIDSSLESLDRVVRQIRATIRALRDPDDVTGLVDRVHGEATRAHIALGFQPRLSLHPVVGLDGLVPLEVADDVVAVVREGLSNAARHACASSVGVEVEADDERIVVIPDARSRSRVEFEAAALFAVNGSDGPLTTVDVRRLMTPTPSRDTVLRALTSLAENGRLLRDPPITEPAERRTVTWLSAAVLQPDLPQNSIPHTVEFAAADGLAADSGVSGALTTTAGRASR